MSDDQNPSRAGDPLASPHKSTSGIQRIRRAFFYSLNGLREAYRLEHAFRQELLLAAVLFVVAALLPTTLLHKAVLVFSVLLIPVVELLNSGIEATIDRVSVSDHELARRAKDFGSAAVFLSLMGCAVVWLLVLSDVFL